ncbi:MAG: hypothetical protein CVV49_13000 [Spirochaetae bacterium HGW-Spirochaetae-5]|nr:MAG: hypothetical protein CVV49_13000 [Spirochaetae bacterium HGW-Spirochaetae-5]
MHKVSLTEYCMECRPDLAGKLKLCISIAVELDRHHKKNMQTVNIRPDSIFIDRDTLEAALNPAEEKNNKSVDENRPVVFDIYTLRYLSPETTGRTDTPVDFRSDYYSLGTVYYEIFAGTPPFADSNASDLIHAHLAGNPIPLHKKNKNIPAAVSEITAKLLEKNPDDRYQSSAGIIHDLRICLYQLNTEGKITRFTAGEQDISHTFRIPEKLYGRHREICIIAEKFSEVRRGQSRSLFLSGPPGIGKSFLVNEVINILNKQNTYFINGKFEQYANDLPYSGFTQAFRSLIRLLLTENEEHLSEWRNKIQKAAGDNGKILTDIIPELIYIIGPQKEIESLPPQETQYRFFYLLHCFIEIFTNTQQTLIIFIDDIQWSDTAGIELMKQILSDASLSILFICAYRKIEIQSNSFLAETLNLFRDGDYHSTFIEIEQVNSEYAAALLEDIFHNEIEDNSVLAEVLIKKTNGNPLFIKEVLLQLHRLGHIYLHTYSTGETKWIYNTEEIRKTQLPETLTGLLADRITLLPEETQSVLKIASCIGVTFSAELIAGMNSHDSEYINAILRDCVKENLLLAENKNFSFIHDKIQETVYSLISEKDLTALHYRIGSHLMAEYESEDEYLFEIVHHMNRSLPLIESEEETERLINLNYRAALKSKKTNAFDSMLIFLKTGISLLKTDSWSTHYDITFSLYKELMECESITKNFAASEKAFTELIKHAESDIVKAEIYSLNVLLLNASGEYLKAIDHARMGLKILNNHLFEFKSSMMNLIIELIKFKLHYTYTEIESILKYPPIHDIKENIAAKIFINLAPALSIVDITGSLILLFRIHNHYLKDKKLVTDDIPANLMGIALAVATALNDYKLACRFGELSLQSIEKYNNNSVKCRMIFLFAFSVNHWKRHAESSLDYYIEAYNSSFLVGDFYTTANSIHSITAAKFNIGHNLNDVMSYYDQHKKVMAQLFVKNNINIVMYDITMRIVYRLISENQKDEAMTNVGDDFITGNSIMAIYFIYVTQMKVHYLFEEHDLLLLNVPFLEKNEKSIVSALFLPEYNFYYSLSIASLWNDAEIKERKKFISILKKNQKKMKTWASLCPENFLHKFLLIQAENARITGKDQKDKNGIKQNAGLLYDTAIASAREQGYINNEAIGNECAAKYYLSAGKEDKAKEYLIEAFRLFKLWGAESKCSHMLKKYSGLLITENSDKVKDRSSNIYKKMSETGENISLPALDLEIIQTATAGISGIRDIEHAIKKILSILCKGTGARRAVLIFFENNKVSLYASVEATAGNEDIFNLQRGTEDMIDVPLSIIRFVKNTGETVNLESIQDYRFLEDPFIKKNRVKSALCKQLLKLKNQQTIMYLENDMLPDLFNKKRMSLIEVITMQLTNALENILLKDMLLIKNTAAIIKESIPVETILQNKYLLTLQEVKISLMLKDGVSRENVCDELAISYKTLKNHLYSIYAKTINLDEDEYAATGRIDKLSRFLLFLMNIEKQNTN